MTSPMTNDELNRAIAELAGLEPEGNCEWCDGTGTEEVPFSDSLDYGPRGMDCRECSGTGGDDIIPDFAHSIDAQKPVEKMLTDAGWALRVVQVIGTGGVFYDAEWWSLRGDLYERTADTEARARAEALLAALQVKNGEK